MVMFDIVIRVIFKIKNFEDLTENPSISREITKKLPVSIFPES